MAVPLLLWNRWKGGGAAGLGGVKFLLRDDFTDTRAAGAVNGTLAVPGGIGTTAQKTRLVLESSGSCRVQSGLAEVVTGGNSISYSDPLLCYGAFSRLPGRFCIFRIRTDATTKFGAAGWSAAQSSFVANGNVGSVSFRSGGSVSAYQGAGLGSVGAALFSYTANTDYDFAIVLRSAGAYIFFKSASYWALGWFGSFGSGTSLYPVAFGTYDALLKTSFMRVPQALWLPTPLAYDTFSRADGVLGSTETIGPDSQAAPQRVWTDQVGTWGVVSNAAKASTLSGGKAIATIPVGMRNVLHRALVTRSAGEAGVVVSWVDGNNYIYAAHDGTNAKLVKVVGGTPTTVINSAATYVAGAPLSVTVDGSSVLMHYNNILVGALATISDGGLMSAQAVGLYTTDTGNSLDGVVVFPRGSNGEYSHFNKYIRGDV